MPVDLCQRLTTTRYNHDHSHTLTLTYLYHHYQASQQASKTLSEVLTLFPLLSSLFSCLSLVEYGSLPLSFFLLVRLMEVLIELSSWDWWSD